MSKREEKDKIRYGNIKQLEHLIINITFRNGSYSLWNEKIQCMCLAIDMADRSLQPVNWGVVPYKRKWSRERKVKEKIPCSSYDTYLML